MIKDKFYDRIVELAEVPKKIKNQLKKIYNTTHPISIFDDRGNADEYDREKYPYGSMKFKSWNLY